MRKRVEMSFNTSRTKTMRRLIATGIIAVNTFTMLNLPASVKAEDDRSCTAAIAKAQRQIQTGRSLEVSTRSFDISEFESDYPDGRPMSYQFVMSGPAVESVMSSPKFRKTIATSVIQNCSSVGVVTFAMNHTGWGLSVGVLPGGRIDFFECLDHPGRNAPNLVWGQEYCNL